MSTRKVRRHVATKQEIIDTAWDLAERNGIAGISLRDIAEAIGMRAPSLYTYFESKDAIYDAMFVEGYRALDEQMPSMLGRVPGDDPVATLGAAVAAFVGFCQSSPARYQLMFTFAVPGWAPSSEAYAASLASYSYGRTLLAEYGIEGEEALDLYTALVSGLAAQQMANDPEGDRWRRLSRRAMEMLVEHIDRNKGADK